MKRKGSTLSSIKMVLIFFSRLQTQWCTIREVMVSVASASNQARGLGSVVTFVVFGWECIAIPETFPLLHQLETKIVDLNNTRCRSIATFGRLYLFAQSALSCVCCETKLFRNAALGVPC